MSYILDALRRAEAERGRGAVPGLHTPAVPAPGAPSMAEPARRGALPWLPVLAAGLAVAGVAAGAAWWLAHRTAVPAEPVRVVAAPVSQPVTPAAATAPAPTPPAALQPAEQPARARVASAAPAPLPAPAPAPAVRPERVAPVTVPATAAAAAAPAPLPAERAASAPLSRASAAAAATARLLPPANGAATPGAPAVAAAAEAPPIVAQRDLPPSLREQLPAMQFSGATYSANPAYRMAIVNGQVLHEGDQAAPGVVLEKIEPSRTVWAFRGYRYAVPSQ